MYLHFSISKYFIGKFNLLPANGTLWLERLTFEKNVKNGKKSEF
jgi:hypothetical protein